MAKINVYDKAKWHYDAESFPEGMPIENGGTHIAFFLRWCVEKDFISKELLEDCEEQIKQIKNSQLDCRQFFIDFMDGVFTSEDLNTKGVKFANAYCTSDKTKFAKKYNFYNSDFDNWVNTQTDLVEKYGSDSAYHYVENSEENYLQIKQIIDNRYYEFLKQNDA